MELLQVMGQAAYNLIGQLLIVWPVGVLLVALYLLFALSGRYKRLGVESSVVAVVLGVIVLLLLAAFQAYGGKAIPYQQIGIVLYYLILIAWLVRTVAYLAKPRK